jgi:hypothetical protein
MLLVDLIWTSGEIDEERVRPWAFDTTLSLTGNVGCPRPERDRDRESTQQEGRIDPRLAKKVVASTTTRLRRDFQGLPWALKPGGGNCRQLATTSTRTARHRSDRR